MVLYSVTDRDLAPDTPKDLEERLERGEVVCFDSDAFPLPPLEDQIFLREQLGRRMSHKNISYHPKGGYLSGLKADRGLRKRTSEVLAQHHSRVDMLLGRLLPAYSSQWYPGKVNYRPLQEQGRDLSRHSSNELVHVDAFASGATHGGRTLRFFTNLNPVEPRVWKSAGLFPELWNEFGDQAGCGPSQACDLQEKLLDRSLSGLLALLARVGLPQALTLDTSPYDRAMKRLHDTLKDSVPFQEDAQRFTEMEFAPFSSWMCLTDMVSHACISGQHALVSTWTVPKQAMRLPELAPYSILSRCGQA